MTALASEVAQQRDVVARKKISREKLRVTTEKYVAAWRHDDVFHAFAKTAHTYLRVPMFWTH